MNIKTLMSDDKCHILVFYEGVDEPEEMDIAEFVAIYGEDALPIDESHVGEILRPDVVIDEPSQEDVGHYYAAFRNLLEICGKYSHRSKLLQNLASGNSKVMTVAQKYYGTSAKLESSTDNYRHLQKTAVANLDYWSRRVGYKPMSTKLDVEYYDLSCRADVDILLGYLANADFRKKLYYRVDRYAKKGELKSVAELVDEVLDAYRKKLEKKT